MTNFEQWKKSLTDNQMRDSITIEGMAELFGIYEECSLCPYAGDCSEEDENTNEDGSYSIMCNYDEFIAWGSLECTWKLCKQCAHYEDSEIEERRCKLSVRKVTNGEKFCCDNFVERNDKQDNQ